MSLLNGLKDALINPLFDAVNEADIDADFEFETALEAVIDKQIELSEEDYAAIMDDENPDNIVADITTKDENPSKIASDAMDDDLKALESMLDELLAMEENIEDAQAEIRSVDPETLGSLDANCKATEMDDVDSEDDEDEPEEDDTFSLDSLLKSVFDN